MATAAAIIIAAQQQEVIAHFRKAGAISAGAAIAYAPGRPPQRRYLERLRRDGVVVETAPGEYYLDEAAYDAMRRKRRRVAAAAVAILSIGAAIIALA